MSTITCNQCGVEIEVTEALTKQLQEQVLAVERQRHTRELAKLKAESEAATKAERDIAEANAKRKLEGERAALIEQAKTDLDIARQRLEAQLMGEQKKQALQQELMVKSLKEDAENEKQQSKELREQLSAMMQALREEKKARENAELEAQKKLAEGESKIREEIQKASDEKQRLNLAAKEKTITDLQKALDEAQRKAAQGSQQLQGEIMELDLERALADAWRDDDISPVPKGVNGADIAHTVRSPRGTDCGLILWEIKRTKNWTEGWIPKLKEDVRNAKAAAAIIVTEAMPKHLEEDMGQVQGVWVCKPKLAIVLGTLIRNGLLGIARQKALAENKGDKADALYQYVTSQEFAHQVESMVETYQEMTMQIQKERVAYEKMWQQRQKQTERLFMGTANIYGSVQGHIGQASMPKIKGLELLEAGEE